MSSKPRVATLLLTLTLTGCEGEDPAPDGADGEDTGVDETDPTDTPDDTGDPLPQQDPNCRDLSPWLKADNVDVIDPAFPSTAWLAPDFATEVDINKFAGSVPVDGHFLTGTDYPGVVDPFGTDPWIEQDWISYQTGVAPTAATGCADPTTSEVEVVSGTIDAATTWSCDTVYQLDGIVQLEAVLTVEPGTVIRGLPGSLLVVGETAELDANATADAPIVFTSDAIATGTPDRGDWGGIVMIGKSTVNAGGGVGTIDTLPGSPLYGGGDPGHACGVLRWVRVEYAGGEVDGASHAGVSLYACGQFSRIDYLQVHQSGHDGLAVFGGHTNVTNVVVTGAARDGVHIREGFDGDCQFFLIQQEPGHGRDGFVLANNDDDYAIKPKTRPRVANVTVLADATVDSRALRLTQGTQVEMYNSVWMGAQHEGVLVEHIETKLEIDRGELVLDGNLVWGNGASIACVE